MAGASVWNSLLDYLRSSDFDNDSFKRSLQTFLFARLLTLGHSVHSAGLNCVDALITYKFTFTLHLFSFFGYRMF